MQIAAFIIAIAAVVCFLIEFGRSQWRSLVALGLALLTIAWIIQLVVQGSTVTLH